MDLGNISIDLKCGCLFLEKLKLCSILVVCLLIDWLVFREIERESKSWAGEGQREREEEDPNQAPPSAQNLMQRAELLGRGQKWGAYPVGIIMTWAEFNRQSLTWLSHPGALEVYVTCSFCYATINGLIWVIAFLKTLSEWYFDW